MPRPNKQTSEATAVAVASSRALGDADTPHGIRNWRWWATVLLAGIAGNFAGDLSDWRRYVVVALVIIAARWGA